jgi:hypothetical protein
LCCLSKDDVAAILDLLARGLAEPCATACM